MGEVDAAKGYPPPNLLIIIGNRYGWIPLPYAIARDEFGAVAGWLEDRNRPDAVRALRMLYQHDDNYLVPGSSVERPGAEPLTSAYTLRSRTDEVPELRAHDRWVEVETELRGALQQAADDLLKRGRIDVAAHEKYFLSLTEQEIIRGLSHRNGSDEVSLPSPSDGPEAIAFFRGIVNVAGGGTGAGHAYIQREPRVDGLKERIKRSLADNCIISAHVTLDASGRLSGKYLANFAAQIEGALRTAVDKHEVRFQAIERLPNYALESERYAHRTFAREQLKIFVGRERDLAVIAQYEFEKFERQTVPYRPPVRIQTRPPANWLKRLLG